MASEYRVVMVGKTGVGKSCLGNSLIHKEKAKYYSTKTAAGSVTDECKRGFYELPSGENLLIIDTPGLFDTANSNEECVKEITKCIALSSPGPHIFLFVLSVRRFTNEEIETLEILKKTFGEKVMNYVIVVFTEKDQLEEDDEDIDDFVQESPLYLRRLLAECNNRYVAICNRVNNPSHNSDVEDVTKLILRTIRQHGNAFFSQELFERVEKILKEEEERRIQKDAIEAAVARERLRQEMEKGEMEKEYQKKIKEESSSCVIL